MRTTDSQLSASNTTGSFQKSEPMQLSIPDGPFWNKSHEPNPKTRDMMGLLAEDLDISERRQKHGACRTR